MHNAVSESKRAISQRAGFSGFFALTNLTDRIEIELTVRNGAVKTERFGYSGATQGSPPPQMS